MRGQVDELGRRRRAPSSASSGRDERRPAPQLHEAEEKGEEHGEDPLDAFMADIASKAQQDLSEVRKKTKAAKLEPQRRRR